LLIVVGKETKEHMYIHARSGGSMDLSLAQPVGMASSSSERINAAGRYCMPPPPAANKFDPLQLSIAPYVPAINLNLSLSLSSLEPQVPAINLSQAAPVPNNTWLSMKTANPFEPPLRKWLYIYSLFHQKYYVDYCFDNSLVITVIFSWALLVQQVQLSV
jgi:hypothetical protein